MYSAGLILKQHNVAEPRPDQVKQPQTTALLLHTCTVGTLHYEWIASCVSLLMCPSLWNSSGLIRPHDLFPFLQSKWLS